MYKNFFGFKERPFQLVPNPAYLYLSRGHEEALAHLTYAISQGDGFVEITGEVGTGKTTLCRAFLENLGEEGTEAAFIFNPKLDAVDLLKAVNDEFGIDSSADSIKALIDELNAFLLQKRTEGHKVILLIDEAQNLSKDVLEQLRLLSNLETTTSKLLQIILVGQPELGEMLDSHDLRQLGQRITLSCHLNPLSFRESRDYIHHRLRVAARKGTVQFTRPAMRIIHRYSGGVPRLINIACDRALLTAFGLNRKKVTAGIARSAVRELADRRSIKGMNVSPGWRPVAVALVLVLAFVAAGLYFRGQGGGPIGPEASAPRSDRTAVTPPAPAKPEVPPGPAPKPRPEPAQAVEEAPGTQADPLPVAQTPEDLDQRLAGVDAVTSRRAALEAVLRLWSPKPVLSPYLEAMERDGDVFEFAAKQNGLRAHRIQADLSLLKRLNVPAVLRMSLPGAVVPRYMTLSRVQGDRVTLHGGDLEDGPILAPTEVLLSRWTGEATLFWKNFLNYEGKIPEQGTRESLITLKMLLQDIGFESVDLTPYYDGSVRDAVQAVQKRNGIGVDGVVGPLTKIVLYNEKKDLDIPNIVAPIAAGRVSEDEPVPAGE